ncbi:MAG: tetratricopeptide repeat protein [Thermodesulfobacteriota bacterium]|nr:tetratricopeptide repeat protein [Thermodesulfobacteriota bacterium]
MARMERVSLARKRELEQPDRFLAMFIATSDFVKKYSRQLAIGVGAIALIALIIAGSTYFSAKKEASASDMLAQVNRQFQAAPDTPLSDIKDRYLSVYEKYSGTVAGKIARIQYADICYKAGDLEAAVEAYQDALKHFKKGSITGNLLSASLGYAHEKNGDTETAIHNFQTVANDPDTPVKAYALFNLGRLYEDIGDMEKSREAYQRIVSDYPNSRAAEVAREKTS